jgi:protein-disulfide isomerase
MSMRWLLKRCCLIGMTAGLVACMETTPPDPADGQTAKGTEDLAEQIEAIQQDLRGLRQDMAAVRQAVTEIHRARVSPPAVAPVVETPVDVMLDTDDPVVGSPGAEVVILEFSDFECPFCRRYQTQVYPEIRERYIDTGKVRYVFRDFPLGFHAQARPAAVAANCAARQGKFEEVKTALFQNQRRLGSELYAELAAAHDLAGDLFEQCLENPDLDAEIDKDLAYGQTVGVSGTPTFFIGRIEQNKLISAKRLVGARPLASFASVLDSLLATSD